MKKALAFLLITCFSVLNTTFAQSKEKDEAAVASTVEALKKAMIDADKATLESLTDEALSYGHSNGKIEDKAEFVRAIVSGESDFVTINLTEQTIKIVGNAAIVRHKLAGTTNNSGKPGTANLSLLMVWQKQKGGWKLLARQAVKI